MNDEVLNLLKVKWQEGSLAHFYIFKTQSSTNSKQMLIDLAKSFLLEVIQKEKNISKENALHLIDGGHPDVLFINENDRIKQYTLQDEAIKEFINFQTHNCFEFSHRFLVLNDAHLLSTIVLNKFLKTLEEPTKNTTIIFLEHTGVKLLPTIESRAITINFAPSSTENESACSYTNFFDFIGSKHDDFKGLSINQLSNVSELISLIGTDIRKENIFINSVTEWILSSNGDYNCLDTLCDTLKHNKKSSIFHNSRAQRINAANQVLLKALS